MTNPDFRALCAELVDACSAHFYGAGDPSNTLKLLNKARAALAQEQQGPADDVENLAQLIYEEAIRKAIEERFNQWTRPWVPGASHPAHDVARDCARAVLERWGGAKDSSATEQQPAPVAGEGSLVGTVKHAIKLAPAGADTNAALENWAHAAILAVAEWLYRRLASYATEQGTPTAWRLVTWLAREVES